MFSRSLVLVLLGLTCLQSFTTAQNGNGPDRCCLSYQTHRIPVRLIKAYRETELQCTLSGVIFTLKSGRQVCADPGVKWVKRHMTTIDQRQIESSTD